MNKTFDQMRNKFVCSDTSNDMKIISCIDSGYSPCTSIVNFDINW